MKHKIILEVGVNVKMVVMETGNNTAQRLRAQAVEPGRQGSTANSVIYYTISGKSSQCPELKHSHL